GTDVLSNVGPPTQVTDAGALVNRHPPGHYALDTHVDTGITNPSGLVGLIPHFLASQLWDLTKFLVLTTISLFTWAFSLDLLGGGSGPGALAPVSEAVERIYAHTFGAAWLAVGIVLAGLWGIWKAFVQRRYAETAGQLALSVGFVVLALFFVHAPERTIGRASEWTNQMSLAFLAGATDASLENPSRAKAEVADHLFRTLVHEPWIVLNFGGLRHCVDAEHRPVAPHSPARERCIDHVRSVGGRGGYAERFLRYPPGSEARNAEYEAIKEGRIPGESVLGDLLPGSDFLPGLPVFPGTGDTFSGILPGLGETSPDQFDGYRVDEDDRPAADIQQQAAGFQRLTMATLIFAGDLGAVVLLGALAIAVILAQVFVLLFLTFAPVALVAGVFPGPGHALFQEWLRRLAGALVRKAFYSLVLAAVLAVGSALLAASDSLGWLYAFGLQAAFYWAVFLKRHSLSRRFATAAGAGIDSHVRPVRVRRVGRLVEQAARPHRSRRHQV
ncbi:MAG: type IV secretion system protein, partial [Gaiellaceae bacterium]